MSARKKPASQPFIRLSPSAAKEDAALGPLSDLVGTWIGTQGLNVVAVPAVVNDRDSFAFLQRKYIETITFVSIGAAVPNRGIPKNTFVSGLQYELRVTDLETNEPLHVENGMWLLLDSTSTADQSPIARLASIPHGNAVLALGNYQTVCGPPQIPDIDTTPDPGVGAPMGYTEDWTLPRPEPTVQQDPNQLLKAAIVGLDITKTVILDVSTENGGGVLNIPFITHNANTTTFACQLWLETIQDQDTGTEYQQLQYSQQTNIAFLPRFDNPKQLIVWPHANVNTLKKQ